MSTRALTVASIWVRPTGEENMVGKRPATWESRIKVSASSDPHIKVRLTEKRKVRTQHTRTDCRLSALFVTCFINVSSPKRSQKPLQVSCFAEISNSLLLEIKRQGRKVWRGEQIVLVPHNPRTLGDDKLGLWPFWLTAQATSNTNGHQGSLYFPRLLLGSLPFHLSFGQWEVRCQTQE